MLQVIEASTCEDDWIGLHGVQWNLEFFEAIAQALPELKAQESYQAAVRRATWCIENDRPVPRIKEEG